MSDCCGETVTCNLYGNRHWFAMHTRHIVFRLSLLCCTEIIVKFFQKKIAFNEQARCYFIFCCLSAILSYYIIDDIKLSRICGFYARWLINFRYTVIVSNYHSRAVNTFFFGGDRVCIKFMILSLYKLKLFYVSVLINSNAKLYALFAM